MLSFHRLELWVDGYFAQTSLYEQGYICHMGHNGQPCPGSAWTDVPHISPASHVNFADADGDMDFSEDADEDSEELGNLSEIMEDIVTIIHTTGSF